MTLQIDVDDRYRVTSSISFDLPYAASTVWGQMRDAPRFMTMDPLHDLVRITNRRRLFDPTPLGARLRIRHRRLGISTWRVGRILRWREGRGFVFSDLSKRGPCVGFPHICWYDLEAIDGSSRLTFGARGKWTATWMPRPIVRWWLRCILRSTAHDIRLGLSQLRLAHPPATTAETEALQRPPRPSRGRD